MADIVRSLILLLFVSSAMTFAQNQCRANSPTTKHAATVWPKELEKPDITEGEFTKIFADVLRAETGANVTITKPLELAVENKNGFKGTSYLGNAWASCKSAAGHRKEILQHYMATELAVANDKSQFEKPMAKAVVPLVKSQEYINQVSEATKGAKGAKDAALVTESIGGDLFLVYGLDLPTGIQLLTESSLHDLGVARAELKSLAHKNIQRILSSGVSLVQRGNVIQVKADGNYETSLLVNEKFWNEEAAKQTGADIVLIVPSRDTVLYTNSKDTKAIAALKDIAEHIYQTGDHVISNKLYRWDTHSNKWQITK